MLVSRFLEHKHNAPGTIYGTIVAASTILAAAESTHDVSEIAVTVVATLLLYWVAHAYAEVLGGSHAEVPFWVAARDELTEESSMITACVLPVAALLVSARAGASFDLATSIALWVAAGVLFVWGLLTARRLQRGGRGLKLVSGAFFGLLGVAIVVLKTFLVH